MHCRENAPCNYQKQRRLRDTEIKEKLCDRALQQYEQALASDVGGGNLLKSMMKYEALMRTMKARNNTK